MQASSREVLMKSGSPGQQFSRRVLAKASAGLAAALAGAGTRASPIIAEATATVAGVWKQPDGIGGETGSMRFEADTVFTAIAPHWSGDVSGPAAVEIAVSADGVTFSEPKIIGAALADAGPLDRDGRVFGQLMMTEQSKHVEYRALDANGDAISLPGLEFTYIDAAGGPAFGEIQTASLPDTLSRPPIITRDQWGASLAYDGWDAGTYEWAPEYRTVEHIIIHHSETSSFRDPLVEIRSIHYYHAVTRGWGDIGYNYLVDYLGNVYEGRKGGENVVGGHAYQYAYGSAGVCSMGSFSLETSTPEAIGALVWISAWAGRNLDPLARSDFHETPNLPTIAAHRDVNDSSCPGDALYADLPYIRWATAEVMTGTMNAQSDASFEPGEVIETTVGQANLRSGPATDASIEAALEFGTVLTIIEGPTTNDGYSWYRVAGQRSAGWLATTTFTSSSANSPARQYEAGTKVEIATDLLNIRAEPGIYEAIVATLTNGDSATVVDQHDAEDGLSWLNVDSALGTGWVAEQYVAPSGRSWIASSFAIGDGITVETDALTLRTDASRRAGEIATLRTGTSGTVIGGPRRSEGITWLHIETEYGSGWVDEQYLGVAGTPAPAEGRFAVGDQILVDTDALNLRTSAGVDSSIRTVLWTGTPGVIVEGAVARDDYLWYQIETEQDTGWVVDAFLAPYGDRSATASEFEPGTAVEVSTDAVNLRSSMSTSSDILHVLYNAEIGTVVGASHRSEGYTWTEVRFGGETGWVASSYLSKSSGSPTATTNLAIGGRGEVTSDNLNVRGEPSLSGSVAGQLFTGTAVDIVAGPTQGDGFTWYEVDAGTITGWTVDVWLQASEDEALVVGGDARVFDGELNLRSGPSTGDDVARILPNGAIVTVLDGPESDGQYDWYRVTSSRYGTGWTAGAWLRRA